MPFICSAWNNGQHASSGAGYGLKVPISARDKYFKNEWTAVTIALPINGGFNDVVVNIAKPSFWNETCHELISKEIGEWLRNSGLAPWLLGSPPTVVVEPDGEMHFKVTHVNSPQFQRTAYGSR